MPKQGQSVESCILTVLYKKRGDTVAPGESLFSYETDKASFEEESKVAGQVLEVFFNEGDEVPVLSDVMVIGEPGESIDRGLKDTPSVSATDAQPSPVSPRARVLAEKHGIDAETLAGSGPEGRVIEKDVIIAVETSPRITPLAKAMMKAEGLPAPASGDGLAGAARSSNLTTNALDMATVKPLPNMRKLIAKAMHASLQNSAQLTHHMGADARRIMELRKQAKAYGSSVTR